MKKVSIHAAKTQLSRLLVEVEQGAEIEIQRRGQTIARLSRIKKNKSTRSKVGLATSPKIHCTADAFLPLSKGELEEWGME